MYELSGISFGDHCFSKYLFSDIYIEKCLNIPNKHVTCFKEITNTFRENTPPPRYEFKDSQIYFDLTNLC